MSKIILYHNPRCSKSREALAILQQKDLDIDIIEYLKTPLSLSELHDLLALLGLDNAHAMVRNKEAEFKQAGLNKQASDSELLAAIAAYPKLMERPIGVLNKKAVIARPPERVHEVLEE